MPQIKMQKTHQFEMVLYNNEIWLNMNKRLTIIFKYKIDCWSSSIYLKNWKQNCLTNLLHWIHKSGYTLKKWLTYIIRILLRIFLYLQIWNYLVGSVGFLRKQHASHTTFANVIVTIYVLLISMTNIMHSDLLECKNNKVVSCLNRYIAYSKILWGIRRTAIILILWKNYLQLPILVVYIIIIQYGCKLCSLI